MLSLPLLAPRDAHELWFGPRPTSHHPAEPASTSTASSHAHARRNNSAQYRTGSTAQHASTSLAATNDTLSALVLEERALRARRNNIASFGCSWIKPAGCPKTMLGMKEEEAEREEAMAAAEAEFAAAAAAAEAVEGEMDGEGEGETAMERDLDADIPDADGEGEEGDEEEEGLVEDGEEGLEEEEGVDEEGYMERDLDDDIPEAYPDYDDDEGEGFNEEDFDNQADLDDEIPSADDGAEYMSELEQEQEVERDLDDDIPEADEEWQHTDTDAEFDDEEDEASFAHHPFRTSTASRTSARGLPRPSTGRPSTGSRPQSGRRETEAQRRFLQRWSGGADALSFDTSTMSVSMMADDFDDHDRNQDHGRDLRASLASQTSRRSSGNTSVFGRFPRRRGRSGMPRDSLEY